MVTPKSTSPSGGVGRRRFMSGRIARTPEEKEQARQEHMRYEEQKKARDNAEIERAQNLSKAESIARS